MPRTAAVEVWSASLDQDAETARTASRCLSPGERTRARRFRFARDRRRFVVAHAALRWILGSRLDVPPATVDLTAEPLGKPVLGPVHRSSLKFSLSHSGERAMIAVSEARDVGVDVECGPLHDDPVELARFCFGPSELAALERLDKSRLEAAFLRTWTAKEAYLKGLGVGLTVPLSDLDVLLPDGAARFVPPATLDPDVGGPAAVSPWTLRSVREPDAIGAVALEGRELTIRRRRLDLAAVLHRTPETLSGAQVRQPEGGGHGQRH